MCFCYTLWFRDTFFVTFTAKEENSGVLKVFQAKAVREVRGDKEYVEFCREKDPSQDDKKVAEASEQSRLNFLEKFENSRLSLLDQPLYPDLEVKNVDIPYVSPIQEEVRSEVEKQLVAANSQGETEGSSVPKETVDNFFVEAAGGMKRRRIHGLGDLGSSIVSNSQSAATRGSSTIEEIISQNMERERAEMNDKLKESNKKAESMSEELAQTKEKMEQQSKELKSQGEN